MNGEITKTCGLHKFAYIKDDVVVMIQVGYEEKFNCLANFVHRYVVSDANLLSKFFELLDPKENYAHYIISIIPVSLDVCGSTPAEKNHSSVKSHLGRECIDSADCIVRYLLHRQNYLSLKRSRNLFEYYLQIKHICESLRKKV